MREELQTQKRKFMSYAIMWFVSVVASALVAGEYDIELIQSMGPEGHAIVD